MKLGRLQKRILKCMAFLILQFGIYPSSKKTMKVGTKNAKCSNEDDKIMLTRKIEEAGGFDELDKIIVRFRAMAKRDLKEALSFEAIYGTKVSSMDIVPKEDEADDADDDSLEEFSA